MDRLVKAIEVFRKVYSRPPRIDEQESLSEYISEYDSPEEVDTFELEKLLRQEKVIYESTLDD